MLAQLAREWRAMIFNSQQAIKDIQVDKSNAQDFSSGIRVYIAYSLALSLALTLIFASLLAFPTLLLGGLKGLASLLIGSPLASLLGLVLSLALGLGILRLAVLVIEWMLGQLSGKGKPGKDALYFNTLIRSTMPFAVFAIIPILGWLVALVGSLINAYRSFKAVYSEASPLRFIASHVVAWVACLPFALIGNFASAMLTGLVARVDPLSAIVQGRLPQSGQEELVNQLLALTQKDRQGSRNLDTDFDAESSDNATQPAQAELQAAPAQETETRANVAPTLAKPQPSEAELKAARLAKARRAAEQAKAEAAEIERIERIRQEEIAKALADRAETMQRINSKK